MLQHPPREDHETSWLWVGLWTLAIFATIPLARTIQTWVTERGFRDGFLLVVLFAIILGLAAALTALIHSGLHRDRSRLVSLFGIALVYGWLSYALRSNPEEAIHFVQYGVLALLVFRALAHRLRDRSIYLATAAICAMIGMLDEFVQWIVPRRIFDFRDIWLNAQGSGLMTLALAFGLRPAYIQPRFELRGLRFSVRLLIAATVIMLLFFSNTGKVKAWYREFIPDVHKIPQVMAEYGYRIEQPELGLTFYSRLPPDLLLATDRERGLAEAPVISEYRSDRAYGHFLHLYQPYDDPYMHEARVRLFRRDRHALLAIRSFDDPQAVRYHTTIAYREDQIMRHWFPHLYHASAYAWSDELLEGAHAIADLDTPYRSPVSSTVFTGFTRIQAQLGASLLLMVLIVWERRLTRRLRAP
ncbi:MAG TPA: VanZ family protein [Kiritimatiellia bacterium]|nr:VanZ family protein [Kiritimatiellia bacterium]